jgi:hypothetical protein
MPMEKILIKLDLGDGFPDGVDPKIGDHKFRKPLDYMNTPFRRGLCK